MLPKHFYTSLLVLIAPLLCREVAAEPVGAKYMGTGSCSSSNCHGSVNALRGSHVLQNEYHTWLKHDKHSQAYSVLANHDSKRIAELMRLGDPQQEPLCLSCHATYVPNPSDRGDKYVLEDGVSCESCHGPAEKWLTTHTVAGATHAQNVENGLRDMVVFDKRGKLCLSCHYGTDEKTVNHDLYGAGHPRLSFELDTFGVLQPKHWIIDDDYKQRKGDYSPLHAWFLGQLVQAEETLAALESPKRSKNGTFPELSLFDCNSCHHSLTEDQWKERTYGGRPGQLNLNLPSLVLLREAVIAINPHTGQELKARMNDLHLDYKNDMGRNSIPTIKRILTSQVAPLAEQLATLSSEDQKTAKAILRQLSTFASNTPWLKYEVAEQVAMGMQAILASIPSLGAAYKPQLDEIFASLSSSEAFKPDRFTAATRKLASAIKF